jgi:5-methyltetrahydrofolate--homocysteine methyltransferase
MTRELTALLKKGILLGDGAMGTMIQALGLDAGELPELLNLSRPESIQSIHAAYFAAGSDYVSTNTFGANRLKLAAKGRAVGEVVAAAAGIARAAASEAGGRRCVALDIGPVGRLLEPMGDMTAEEAGALYREQAAAGAKAGVDFIILETFTDLFEIKTAALAAMEACDLPIFCSVTFQEDGRMLTGADPATAVHSLQDMGIAAIGVNCSMGPRQMLPLVRGMIAHARIPFMAQPNAGLPREENGRAVYDVNVEEFAGVMREMMEAGVSVVGGCCGTTPEYIRALRAFIDGAGSRRGAGSAGCAGSGSPEKDFPSACSPTRTVIFDGRVRVVGERLNPTGKKRLKQALLEADYDYIEDEAIAQVRDGAEILEVNMGLPEADEKQALLACVRRIEGSLDAPLMIDSTDAAAMEAAVRACRGKPVVNSVNGEARRMEEIFPIVKKYGTAVVALTLDEKGIPESVSERLAIIEKMMREAEKYGIRKERLIVDCLAMTVSAQQDACRDTLEAMRLVKERFGLRTALGVSNISFGLPERGLLNRTFLAMAMLAGLDAPILDPANREAMNTVRGGEALLGKDRDSSAYIAHIGAEKRRGGGGSAPPGAKGGGGAAGLPASPGLSDAAGPSAAKEADEGERLGEIIRKGFESRAAEAAERLLTSREPLEVIEKVVLPALEIVGNEYETGEIFLPQMIKSAETAKRAFEVLRRVMNSRGGSVVYGRVILATVKDDVHDIGKNIVKAIMENYGYEILDLGKDVPPETILRAAREEKIRLVGLSALMTTTVINMEKTIKLLKSEGLDCVTAVGGAVLNADYARKIGADYYCRNAMDAVHVANGIFKP